jgi:quercetin dioxygenase-like cupin family protein
VGSGWRSEDSIVSDHGELFSEAETFTGPADWFAGTVWIETIANDPEPPRLRASRVTFSPGARTAWHTHPAGQILHILDGVAWVQDQDGPVHAVSPGGTVTFAPGERHWHGASPDRPMTHLAMQNAGAEGSQAEWGEHVSDSEYGR